MLTKMIPSDPPCILLYQQLRFHIPRLNFHRIALHIVYSNVDHRRNSHPPEKINLLS